MHKKFYIFSFVVMIVLISIGCREVTAEMSEPIVFEPTPATFEKVSDGAQRVIEVKIVGNAIAGEEWFASQGCNACHSTGSDKLVGPGQLGIYERAATRSEYSSPEDYIESSIRYPAEYIVEGFTNLMPTTWEDSEKQEIADIIEYLKTLK
tara:strand:+ start:82 stop:534 length:453 start_codon:yes stop_codon:yes gene_type:complete